MLSVFIVFVLIIISLEDFKYRTVRLLLFPLLLVLLITSMKEISLSNVLLNIAYLLFLTGIGATYLFIKYKTWVLLTNSIGVGDVLFLLVLSCWFSPVDYILFNSISFTVALVLHFILNRVSASYRVYNSIPLAGVQSICFLIVFIFSGLM